MAFWSDMNRLSRKYNKRKKEDEGCWKIYKDGKKISIGEYKNLSENITNNPCSEVEYYDDKRESYVVLFSDEDLFVTITREKGNKIITSYHFEKSSLGVNCEGTKRLTKEEAKIKIREWIEMNKNKGRVFDVIWNRR